MDIPASARHGLILVRDLGSSGADDRALRRDADSGRLVRILRGVYVDAATWAERDDRSRHLALAAAAARTSVTEHVHSHTTAAAIHGIPLAHGYPLKVHITVPRGTSTRFRTHYHAHRTVLGARDVERIDGLLVTSARRTVIDLAVSSSFPEGVAAVDWWLTDRHRWELQECLDGLSPRTGLARAEAAIRFGDGRSGSVGESLSRASMHVLRFPAPELQHSFSDGQGLIGVVDYWWPAFGLIGEFDGRGKYLRPEFTKGKSTAEVVLAEKRREDRLRALGPRVARWDWAAAIDPAKLSLVLLSAGLRQC